jgi:GNAT superfamily N-acetyltransferase
VIRKANDQDKTALREIWSAAFNDPLSYADFVIEHCLKLGTVLFDDCGRSFLTRFPLTLLQKGKILLQGFYIYGLATHPVQQGKGFGSLLLTKAVEETPFCLLYPATAELQRFYYNRGFITPVRIPDAVSKTLPAPGIQENRPEFLYKQYLEDATNQDFVFLWPASMFEFALEECLFRKGFVSPPWFCYQDQDEILCKPYISPSGLKDWSYTQGWAMFQDTVPGFESGKSVFYLPLD